jgi:hypothetical protein
LKAVTAIVAARKKGRGKSGAGDGMDVNLFCNIYLQLAVCLSFGINPSKIGPNPNKIGVFLCLIGQSEQIWAFLRPDAQSEQILTCWVNACCNPNIFGEIFENLSVHKAQIFGKFHLALPPIVRGPIQALRDYKSFFSALRKVKCVGISFHKRVFNVNHILLVGFLPNFYFQELSNFSSC